MNTMPEISLVEGSEIYLEVIGNTKTEFKVRHDGGEPFFVPRKIFTNLGYIPSKYYFTYAASIMRQIEASHLSGGRKND